MILDHFALSHICDNCPVRVNLGGVGGGGGGGGVA